MRPILLATIAAMAMPGAASLAQAPQPAVRELLKTGPSWVSGVAEPESGQFIAYADSAAIRIYNRKTQTTASLPVVVDYALGSTLSISRSGRRLIFPVRDDTKHTYIWSVELDLRACIRQRCKVPWSHPGQRGADPHLVPPDGCHWQCGCLGLGRTPRPRRDAGQDAQEWSSTGLHGNGTSRALFAHPSSGVWTVQAKPGSVARLWNLRDRGHAVDRGLYSFSFQLRFMAFPSNDFICLYPEGLHPSECAR